MKCQCDSLFRLMAYSLSSAFVGLVAGFLLGYIIYGVGYLLYPEDISEGLYYVAPFLGMAFGTAIGAILGGTVAIKKVGK